MDNGIISGTRNAVDYMKNMIKEDFNIMEWQGRQRKHLGMEYKCKNDKYGEYWDVQMKKFWIDMIHKYEVLTG